MNFKIYKLKTYIVFAILGVAIGVTQLFFQYNFIRIHTDSIKYVSSAKFIADGKGYIGDLSDGKSNEILFPPMIPLLYAAIIKLFGYKNLFPLYLWSFLLFIFSIAVTLLFIRTFSQMDNKYIVIIILLFIFNGILLRYSLELLSECFFYVLSLLSLVTFKRFLEIKDNRLFIWTVLFVSFASYTRASGLSLCFAIVIVTFFYFKFRWQFFLALFPFIPLLSFFFYQWLFFGVANDYLKSINFFLNWNIQRLKFNIGELIFYIPSQAIFYLFGDKDTEWLLSKLHTPIIWLTKGVRLDWMGILSILFWIPVVLQSIKKILSKEYILTLYLFLFIIMFVFHTCPAGCADPRYFLQVLPIVILFFVESLIGIKKLYIKSFFFFTFIVSYLLFNTYGIVQYDREMISLSKKDILIKDISACFRDTSNNKVDIERASMYLFKLCFNKGYGYLDKDKIYQFKGGNLLVYTFDTSNIKTLQNVVIKKELKLKNNDYLLLVSVND